jgi:hypothetical protein
MANYIILSAYREPTQWVFLEKIHLRCGIKNVPGDDIQFETKYTVLALQMLPHAVGSGRRRQIK